MSAIGSRVGPFEIVEQAVVPEPGRWFLARRSAHTRRRPDLALIKLADADEPDADMALQREFERLRILDDRRLPKAIAWYEGSSALAVEARKGTSLTVLVTARRTGSLAMTPPTLLDLALDLTDALMHLHRKGLVHGHLSAGNVWLQPDGGAMIWGAGLGPDATPDPQWAAPERIRGSIATEATDQWSLGALLAALVTGHPPWRSTAAGRRGDIDAAVQPVESQWPALGRTLRRMCDPHPANRFDSLHAVRRDLLALARKAGGASDLRELAAHLAGTPSPPTSPSPEAPMSTLPSEDLRTVQPEITSEVPLAVVGTTPPPARMRTESPVLDPPSLADLETEQLEDSSDPPSERIDDPVTWEPERTEDPATWEPDSATGKPLVQVELDEDDLEVGPPEVEVELDDEDLVGPFKLPTDIGQLPPDPREIGRGAIAEDAMDAPSRAREVRTISPREPTPPTVVPFTEATTAEEPVSAEVEIDPEDLAGPTGPVVPATAAPISDGLTRGDLAPDAAPGRPMITIVAPIMAVSAILTIVLYALWTLM